MDLIVTHTNADFDAFASLVAAKKLYPGSKLLLPGSQERAVREFLSLVRDEIKIEKEKTISMDKITRVIIVDTRHKSRIGIAAKLIDNASCEVHVYDHHPRMAHDIKGDKDVFQEVGATVSILVDLIRKKSALKITPLEATIMLLAIYEETGSLTYRTTTRLDVDMVSYLLSKGANLQAVSSYLNRKLTESELTFLTGLISSTKIFIINGLNVAIAEGVITHFIGELGTIVRKLHDVENFPVLFVIFRIGKGMRIIARSRLKEVDVNEVLKEFGGGGHRSAASVKIEGKNEKWFKEALVEKLKHHIKTKIIAADIMTRKVNFMDSGNTIAQAKEELKRCARSCAPVMERKKLVGIISVEDIDKALKYNYGHASVKGYMMRPALTVSPGTPLHEAQKIMFEKNSGCLPVVRSGKIIGVITRRDVLKSVHRDIFFTRHKKMNKRSQDFNISNKLKHLLPGKMLGILRKIGKEAEALGLKAYVVGGFVRDIVLGVPNFDIDIVVEGETAALGRRIADLYKGSLVVYKKFGTCTVIMNWPRGMAHPSDSGMKFKIDIASARRESYAKPAMLPTVKFSSLKDDLQRRDFTINAVAASLLKGTFGHLIDFFGGIKDIERGVIRVLHDGSFIDDPTRIFRAVRFEQRFGFRIDKYTERLIKGAVKEGMFSRTHNHRIRDELIRVLKEENPLKAIIRMSDLHEIRFIHRRMRITNRTKVLFSEIKKAYMWYNAEVRSSRKLRNRHIDIWLIYFMALTERLTYRELKELCGRFGMRRSDTIRLLSAKKRSKNALSTLLKKHATPAGIYQSLRPMSFEETLLLWARTENRMARERIKTFLLDYNNIRLKISGKDLKAFGIKPGPLYTEVLREVLLKKIDGKIRTKKEEIAEARKIAG